MFLFAQLQHRQKPLIRVLRQGSFQQILHWSIRKLALANGEILTGGSLVGGGGLERGGGRQLDAPNTAVVRACLERELTADGFR